MTEFLEAKQPGRRVVPEEAGDRHPGHVASDDDPHSIPASERRRPSTKRASKCRAATSRAAFPWRAGSASTAARADTASSVLENANKPWPVGRNRDQPVSWATT